MLNDFLALPYTEAICDKNFAEWHQGIPYYGFWAIIVDHPEHLALINRAQDHLKEFFLSRYLRQPHITLSACGLLTLCSYYHQSM